MNKFLYLCKWIISYFYVVLHRISMKPRFRSQDIDVDFDPYMQDFIPYPEEFILETPLEDSRLISTADEIFFYGVNSKSEYFITQITRGTNQEAEALIYLKLNNGKTFQLAQTSGYQQTSCDKKVFSCGGLQMYYLSPLRRWRIFFNGLLKETDENGEPSVNTVHVKFAFLWLASTNIFDFQTDVNSKALSASLAKAKWNQRVPPLKELFSALDFYAQCGNIMGTISINGSEESEFLFFSEKIRCFGNVSFLKGIDFFHILGNIQKNGRFIHIAEVSIKNVVERCIFGFATVLTGGMRPIHYKSSSLEKFVSEGIDISTTFQTAGQLFHLKGSFNENPYIKVQIQNLNEQLNIECLDLKLFSQSAKEKKSLNKKVVKSKDGGNIGKGIVITRKIKEIPRKDIAAIFSNSHESDIPLVVCFSDKICQNPNITGGKGSSLGMLFEFCKESKNFMVPRGVVVTTRSYELFVTDDILKGVKKLESFHYQNKVDEAKAACRKLINIILDTPMPEKIIESLYKSLQIVFLEGENDYKYAVRSSATGEDTEQMSAAGQMETYLGVDGISNIVTAIKKCWASQFSFTAVQYKRQNGQMMNTPMAVVVQEMISCDTAGVLFTCDPLTGNPTTLSITANYGLGESVVSASAEPDTIEIERMNNEKLTIKNKKIGAKCHKIVLSDKFGTNVEETADDEKQSFCLSNNAALHLAHVAVLIENRCKSYRDIEWGFSNNKLYIFQSRPITSSAAETDFEIDHELDNALRCEEEYFALCNVGEVLPAATSPFGLDVTMKYLKTVFQSNRFMCYYTGELPKYYSRFFGTFSRHFMIFGIDIFKIASESLVLAETFGLAFFSKLINDEELLERARERYSDDFGKLFDLKLHIKVIYRILYGSKLTLQHIIKTYSGYIVPLVECNNSQEMFDQMLYRLSDITLVVGYHWIQTDCSALINMIIFAILRKSAGEINFNVYNDFAMLLKGCETESADVPASMERLASYIAKTICPEVFKKMNTKDALKWLENSPTTAGEKYRDFIKKHGHRCLREFDFYSLTWETDPEPLVKLLQNLVETTGTEKAAAEPEDNKDIFSKLVTPISPIFKFFLRLILPYGRKAVQNRETSKSIFMQVINAWRNEFRKLAKLMVLEGRLPDEDIFFFMTLEEVKELLVTRSPRIISKANQRRRRQSILDKYKFAELFKGFPRPINTDKKAIGKTDGEICLKGIPVSQGVATGVVRVAFDLEEASQLQPGEILITYSTDIGWSPYFPSLAGVVTEIGGLISHGAVISREYGIPCIAGLTGVTNYFQTGDYVLLNGTKGILQKIRKPEEI